MQKLTGKQKRFCEEYLIDLNASQAAVRAGYSQKTANRIASENLSKLDIQKYIKSLMEKRSEKTGITTEKVISELGKVAFADIEISGKEKIKALELLGKHLGMFSDKSKSEFENEAEESDIISALRVGEIDAEQKDRFKQETGTDI